MESNRTEEANHADRSIETPVAFCALVAKDPSFNEGNAGKGTVFSDER